MTFSKRTRGALFLIGVLGNQAWAVAANTAAPAATPLPDVGTSLIRVIGAFAVVMALFFAGVWLFKNWQRVAVHKGRAPELNVLEVKSLGNKHALYVIGYDRQRMLVASSPAGMNLIAQLPEADANEPAAPVTPSFGDALQKVLNRK